MTNKPLIFDLKSNALDDGPGIRTVVFFKGCPLSCVWCHNPEGKSKVREIAFDASACIEHRACEDECDYSALDRSIRGYVNRDVCTLCGQCVEVCPSGALSIIGRETSVDEVVERVRLDMPFYEISGGGVTLSGGEATLFLTSAGELAGRLRELGVHVLLETCGLFDPKRFDALLLPFLDAIYFDLKLFDPDAHRRYVGTDNKRILDNFVRLHKRHLAGEVDLLARIPLIPGITDTPENLLAASAFLSEAGAERVALLAYHTFWKSKLDTLGQRISNDLLGPDHEEIRTDESIARSRSYFRDFDVVDAVV